LSYAFGRYLTANKVSTPRWATWFGTYSEADHTTVLNHFTTISAVGFANYTVRLRVYFYRNELKSAI
jgi:peptidyl-Lys metalloendopeptidase